MQGFWWWSPSTIRLHPLLLFPHGILLPHDFDWFSGALHQVLPKGPNFGSIEKRILESIGIWRLLGLSLGFASSSSSTQPWEEALLIAENENSSKSWTPCPAWGEEWGGSQMSSSIYFACNHTCCLVACRCQGNILWRCFMHQFIITEPSLHRQLTWGEENNVRYQKIFS